MTNKPKYYIIESAALPDIFLKVAEAKRLLEIGEVATVNEATRRTGISRSAFYKYRDSILPFHNMMTGRIVTFQLLLHDIPGVLSNILGLYAAFSCNILTINQTIPTNGSALVTITAETAGMNHSIEDLLAKLSGTYGVVKAEIIAG